MYASFQVYTAKADVLKATGDSHVTSGVNVNTMAVVMLRRENVSVRLDGLESSAMKVNAIFVNLC